MHFSPLVVLISAVAGVSSVAIPSPSFNVTDEDLVIISSELIIRYKTDNTIDSNHKEAYKERLQDHRNEMANLEGQIREKVKRKRVLSRIGELVNAELNTTSPSSSSNHPICQVAICKRMAEKNTPTNPIDQEIKKLTTEIEDLDFKRGREMERISDLERDIADKSLTIEMKTKIMEVLIRLYDARNGTLAATNHGR